MNLEELRSALASDATEKAKAQEKLIKSLKRQLKEKNDTLVARDDVLRTMYAEKKDGEKIVAVMKEDQEKAYALGMDLGKQAEIGIKTAIARFNGVDV